MNTVYSTSRGHVTLDRRGRRFLELALAVTCAAGAVACSGSNTPAPTDGGTDNTPPVALLAYEIELNEWIAVRDGDTVVRPLNADINWDACASYDPDGTVVGMTLYTGRVSTLLSDSVSCGEHTETNHDPRDLAGYLLVRDDNGAETRLRFTYRTE